MWGVHGKKRIKERGLFRGGPEWIFQWFYCRAVWVLLFIFPSVNFPYPPFLAHCFSLFCLRDIQFQSLSLSTSLPFPRICCRRSGWRTWLLQVQVPV